MQTKLKPIFIISLVFSIVTLANLVATPPSAYAGAWRAAYSVSEAYRDSWGIPHYGANFFGRTGCCQYFTGTSTQPSGYSGWNWWGNNLSTLLLEKSWLFAPNCWGICNDRWDPTQHHAFFPF